MSHEAVFSQESFSLESFPSQEHLSRTWDTAAAVDFLLSVVDSVELIFFSDEIYILGPGLSLCSCL